jgi:hypothetical protein
MIPLLLLAIQLAPAAPESPNRQPRLAASGNTVGVTYGSGNTVYFAASKDGGRTFSPAVTVASGGKLSLGMHRGPRLAFTPAAVVISAIVGDQGGGRDGDLVAWRSADGGKSWSDGVHVNDVPGSAREGLHAMAFGGTQTLFAAWLDLRDKGTRVYGSASKDGGATWSPNRVVYESPSGTVCQCCHPSVAIDASGVIYVMFRNSLEGSRDLYLTRSSDAGRTFDAAVKVGSGTWKLEGCPMDGGGVAVDQNGQVSTIWRRDQTIFTTAAADPEVAAGTGRNPTLAVTPAGVFSSWTEGTSVMLKKPDASTAMVLTEDGAAPSLAGLPDGSIVIAWESKGSIAIQVIP